MVGAGGGLGGLHLVSRWKWRTVAGVLCGGLGNGPEPRASRNFVDAHGGGTDGGGMGAPTGWLNQSSLRSIQGGDASRADRSVNKARPADRSPIRLHRSPGRADERPFA